MLRSFLLISLTVLGSLFLLVRQATTGNAQSDSSEPILSIPLPDDWQGPDQISTAEVAQTMPPFTVLQVNGDFAISRVDADNHLRILPVGEGAPTGQRSLDLAWQVDDDTLASMAGNVVEVSLDARGYSPEDGPRAYVADGQGETRASSSESVDDIGWQTYTVSRLIPSDATAVAIGFDWLLPPGNAWLEFRDMAVVVQTPDAFAGPVAATDVPPTPTQTPFAVTSTPLPTDVFAAATLVAKATRQATRVGTATPTPENMVTATFTPPPTETPTPIVLVNTATPENEATATTLALRATAIAFTTGTPTALPRDAVVVTATNTPVGAAAATQKPTPLYVLLENIAPTPTPAPTPEFPQELVGKILFKADFLGTHRKPDFMAMNPDGSELARLNNGYWYNRAVQRDRYSADRQFYAFVDREDYGTRRLQIFYDFLDYGSRNQLTFFGAGTAWDPVWSPTDEVVALVSNESRNDEIWIVRRDEWPAIQLTENDWEWDKHPSWSPDGAQIIYGSNRGDGREQIWIMDSDGSGQRPLTNFPFEAWDPVWVKYPDS